MDYFSDSGAIGCEEDLRESFEMNLKAARRGDIASQINVIVYYIMEKNYKEAEKWAAQVAHDGDAMGRYHYGRLLIQRGDNKRGLAWIRKSANQDNVDAVYFLADRYFKGDLVRKNVKRAIALFEKAADQGHSDAITDLGCFHVDGVGMRQSWTKAGTLFKKGVELGNERACVELAFFYFHGTTVPQDDQKGMELLELAASKGCERARGMLNSFARTGQLLPKEVMVALSESYSRIPAGFLEF